MRLVLNASPIICLAKAGLLNEVLSMAQEVAVPQTVADEILAVDDDRDAAVTWIRTETAQRALRNIGPPAPFVLAWDLGAGESAVLTAVASSPGSVAVLDDLAARRCALALGIDVTGTLGLLLRAKRAGTIVSLRRALDEVTDAGLFVSPKHLSAILDASGE
jgi:predicted nucleic acid-binding protein